MTRAKWLFIDTEVLPAIEWGPEERDRHYNAHVKTSEQYRPDPRPHDLEPEHVWRGTALDWKYGRLWLWGFALDGEPPQVVEANYHPGDDKGTCDQLEQTLLQDFARSVRGTLHKDTLWVGHNLTTYDLRILFLRAMKYGLYDLANQIPYKMWDRRVRDTMKLVQGVDPRGRVKLDDLALFLGTTRKTHGVDGGQVYDLWLESRREEAKEYVKNDVIMCRDVYRELWKCGVGT